MFGANHKRGKSPTTKKVYKIGSKQASGRRPNWIDSEEELKIHEVKKVSVSFRRNGKN